ncbi:MAG: S-layer homology domain-containing protein [Oscillibacter sp.]
MKKLLAMVLALVMTLSLAVSANAFKDDKSISDDYAEAVAVLNGMGVFKGYEDGSFKPTGDITRAEVSAIVYRVYTQDVKDAKASMYATYNKFSDMAGASWAAGYIGYCANASLVKGYPDGTFKPSGKVTGYEVLAMILRAVGYDKNNEFSGADWALHVAQTAQQAGVLKNVKGIDLNAAASRELVAELLFRAIAEASTVTYTPAFGYVTDKVIGTKTNSLGEKNFKLASAAASDKWGRPATKWTYNTGDKSTLVVAKADASYTTKVDECDIAKDLGITKSKAIEAAYIDGDSQTVTTNVVTTDRNGKIDPKATTSLVGAQGRLTEVYDMGSAGYRFIEINTYLAKVTKVTAASTDRNGHVTDATVDRKVYQVNDTGIDKAGVEAEGFTVGQYVLVTMTVDTASPVVQTVEAAAVTPMGQLKNWSYAYGTTAATITLADTSTTMLTSSMSVTSRVPPTLLPLGIPSLTLMPT